VGLQPAREDVAIGLVVVGDENQRRLAHDQSPAGR
jgi:hypothetical protein